ncbi:PREDICTED: hemicentin-1-like [Amphimedon queenslandica]|uniref:Uncharacterized protein n=1 Tax=Amphimedon queenslandica TaxID=400682 RepID=A0A1X7UYA1_AMPQE|nr:PREDICTED: hemicentin-1-like [Amphimedon queenslandica]|eukprot:XP_019851636.1 PREDICTED: hemicentin-1-like [Amphimedon queenslandica]
MPGRFILFVLAYFVSVGGLASAQPTELRIEIKQDSYERSSGQSLHLVFPTESSPNRSISLSPGLNYTISGAVQSGFNPPYEAWYRVLENGTELLLNHTSPDDTTGNAVYAFVIDDGKISLRFQNFSETDVGVYRCKAPEDTKTIIVTTSNPSVISGVKEVTRLDGSYSSDRTFGMLVTGNPQPNFTWTHNGNAIQSSDGIILLPFASSQSQIIITPPFLFKHAGTYNINAANDHGTASDSFEMNIQTYPVIALTPRSAIAYAVAGTPFEITCNDTSAFPPPVITWSFNNTPVTNNTDGFIIKSINSNVSVLSIEEIGLDHAGVYKCESVNAAGRDAEELELKIQLPPPQVPTVTISSPTSPTYSGGMVNLTCRVTLQTSSHFTDPLSANINWSIGNIPIIIEPLELTRFELPRISIKNYKISTTRYTSVLSIRAASVSDSGLYKCGVISLSGIYSSVLVNSTGTALNIEVPPIPVNLSPTSIEVPNFQPYNLIRFNCSISIPTGHFITSHFNWFMDNDTSSRPLLHGQGGVSIVVNGHTSSLSFEAANPGEAKYRCSVVLGFPSTDPNVTLSANSTVNIIGPSKPFLPIRIIAGDFGHSTALIQWTVPSIAYSPESYFIRYGTSRNNLNFKSSTLIGTQDLDAKDQTLSITLRYLTHDTLYYYQVVSTNTFGETNSVIYSLRTTRLALIQFKAGPFLGCSNGRVSDSDAVQVFLKDEISKAVSSSCSCTFPSSQLINGTILCPATDSEQLILRVFVVSTDTVTSAAVVSHIRTWINGDPVLTSGVAKVTFDTSCPVNISNNQVPICMDTIITTTEPTTDGLSDSFGSNTDILVAVVAGAVILLEAVIIVILFCALWHQNSKIRALIRRRSSPYAAVNRQNSSVGATDPPPPSNKWKGDAYVTTECPAYLSAYTPKDVEDMDMVHIDENGRERSPPAIYDSIDLVNGRSVTMSVAPPPPPPLNHHPLSPQRNNDGRVTQSVLMSSEASDTEDNTGSSMMS